MALYAGESAALVERVSSAAEVIERLLNEANDASSRIASLCAHLMSLVNRSPDDQRARS
ncbi:MULTISPECIES: hypothetical protein [Paraburkholderia]|jgi:nitronate monooxygenase|uniref:Uncharacterized protein n=1 Tax=Paraburkholderia fungorum TaxID=134537 RepID=A0AAW3UYQ5_9BURK|nr:MULTISPECIES: hypothetical protein [Paraburkholderia]MBB4515453.1 hypothetical protein [Paraburkholderia fungorum]MBB6203396.1 hypothetical protein [Paraburkholderia fungorum]USX07409.1 hypothetical protein NHH62_32975 [Paraburkholderia fungorum]